MAVQKQDDQHEHTFNSYVRIRDVVLKTYLGRWTIGRSGERGSGISVLPARYDDDDEGYLFVSYSPSSNICISESIVTLTLSKQKGKITWTHLQKLKQVLILLRTFDLILVVFCCFSHYVSAKFHLWPSSGDLKKKKKKKKKKRDSQLRQKLKHLIRTQECCEQYWISPGGHTPQSSNYTATSLRSRKLSKLNEPDTHDTAGEAGTSS